MKAARKKPGPEKRYFREPLKFTIYLNPLLADLLDAHMAEVVQSAKRNGDFRPTRNKVVAKVISDFLDPEGKIAQ